MSTAENEGLARIVIAEGFCTRDQVDRCLRIQSSTDERLSLGQSLLREGFLTREQYSRVLVLLRQGYKRENDTAIVRIAERRVEEGRASARQGQEDRVLGGIVVAEGWISADQLKVVVEEATKRRRSLAETLVSLGYLESARIEAILGRLERMDLSCGACGATLSILRLPTEKSVHCPRCRGLLTPGV
jgi:hypothetical protein